MIPISEPWLGEQEVENVVDCVRSGWISSLGVYVKRFEEGFAKFCGAHYGISVANGTVALHLSLHALNIGRGDEVIIPTLTFVATANAVVFTGAKPVFVDIESETWNIDPIKLEQAITPRTRAIIPVHLYGHPANMKPILTLAEKYNLWVIEDAAEAHGAEYMGFRVGSLGHLGCFSFYGNKIITTGEGGMIVTNDPVLANRLTFLRDHAMSSEKRYWHPEVGFNYRLTNLQAAIGVAQMERIERIIAVKRQHAIQYNTLLADVPGLTKPPQAAWATNVYWLYSLLVEPEYGATRDELIDLLRIRGIDSRPFFYPIHTLPPYASTDSLPVAEQISAKGLNLPSATTLTPEQIAFITSTIRELGQG